MSMSGLPPVPNSLKECLRNEATKLSCKPSGEHTEPGNTVVAHSAVFINGFESLQEKMGELREMDRSLFQNLWSIYESIQDFKQSAQDRLSETNSECSYSMDSQLETIPDYQEHIYVNEKFHDHIYENQHVYEGQLSNSSGYSTMKEEEDSLYEPVYMEPKCHKKHGIEGKGKRTYEKSLSKSSISSSPGSFKRSENAKSKMTTSISSGSFDNSKDDKFKRTVSSTSRNIYRNERPASSNNKSYSLGRSSTSNIERPALRSSVSSVSQSPASTNSGRSSRSSIDSSRSSLGSTPKSNRFSGVFTQTTYESTC